MAMKWRLYRHRSDPGVLYRAQKTKSGYRIRRTCGPTTAFGFVPHDLFETTYEEVRDEQAGA